MSDDFDKAFDVLVRQISVANQDAYGWEPGADRDRAMAFGKAAYAAAEERDFETSARQLGWAAEISERVQAPPLFTNARESAMVLEKAEDRNAAEYLRSGREQADIEATSPPVDFESVAAKMKTASMVSAATYVAAQADAFSNSIEHVGGQQSAAFGEAERAAIDARQASQDASQRSPAAAAELQAARVELADARSEGQTAEAGAAASSGARPAREWPEGFERRYVKDGENVYDLNQRDRALMRDKGNRLDTGREFDSETVKLMVDTAQARGWSQLVVKGSDEFRKAVWTAAAVRGIDVAGYKASAVELAWADKQRETAGRNNAIVENEAVKVFRSAATEGERKQAMAKHPELVSAYSVDGAAVAFARKFIPSEAGQKQFLRTARDTIALDLAQGREMANVPLRRDDGTRNKEKTRTRERAPER